eukprot:scaffold184_cov316-Pinguiococcus_pyrenoidosus.AAC.57
MGQPNKPKKTKSSERHLKHGRISSPSADRSRCPRAESGAQKSPQSPKERPKAPGQQEFSMGNVFGKKKPLKEVRQLLKRREQRRPQGKCAAFSVSALICCSLRAARAETPDHARHPRDGARAEGAGEERGAAQARHQEAGRERADEECEDYGQRPHPHKELHYALHRDEESSSRSQSAAVHCQVASGAGGIHEEVKESFEANPKAETQGPDELLGLMPPRTTPSYRSLLRLPRLY